MTLLGGQIGRTLVQNVLSVNGGGGTGGVAVIAESMSCLGECMWMCVKESPWKIKLRVCIGVGHHHMHKHTLLQNTEKKG